MPERITEILNETRGDFTISTEPSKLDLAFIHAFLSTEAYWSRNIPFEKVVVAARNSLNFGLFHKDTQIGYARVISDFSSIAYLGDVFIAQPFRKQGLSKWLMEIVMSHPSLQGMRRWILLTGDAHGLYGKYGWKALRQPEKWMEIHNPGAYAA